MNFRRRSYVIILYWRGLPIVVAALASIGLMYVLVTLGRIFKPLSQGDTDLLIWLGAILIFIAVSAWFVLKYRNRVLYALDGLTEPFWSE